MAADGLFAPTLASFTIMQRIQVARRLEEEFATRFEGVGVRARGKDLAPAQMFNLTAAASWQVNPLSLAKRIRALAV